MSIINDYKILNAYFTNDERIDINVELVEPDSTPENVSVIMYSVEAKEGDTDFEALLKYVDIDALHENTVNKFRQDRANFEAALYYLGNQEGMVYHNEQNPVHSDLYDSITDILFGEFDPEAHKEKLFMLKLKLFENEVIKASKDRPLKAKLRKAKNFVDVFKYATMIYSPEETT